MAFLQRHSPGLFWCGESHVEHSVLTTPLPAHICDSGHLCPVTARPAHGQPVCNRKHPEVTDGLGDANSLKVTETPWGIETPWVTETSSVTESPDAACPARRNVLADRWVIPAGYRYPGASRHKGIQVMPLRRARMPGTGG